MDAPCSSRSQRGGGVCTKLNTQTLVIYIDIPVSKDRAMNMYCGSVVSSAQFQTRLQRKNRFSFGLSLTSPIKLVSRSEDTRHCIRWCRHCCLTLFWKLCHIINPSCDCWPWSTILRFLTCKSCIFIQTFISWHHLPSALEAASLNMTLSRLPLHRKFGRE
jgi:hypothetical protein